MERISVKRKLLDGVKSIEKLPQSRGWRGPNEEELSKIARFVIVIVLASLLLAYLSSLNLEMKFARRQVAQHTNTVLHGMGINSYFYDHSVKVPKSSNLLPKIDIQLTNLGMEEVKTEDSLHFLSGSLHPKRERVLNSYLQKVRSQGYRVYYSPATIMIPRKGGPLQVDIIPECVGWLGLFAVIALIIAYPEASWRERILGISISIPLMYLMNLIRLSTTIYAGWAQGIDLLNVVHDVLWKTLLIFWALLLWIVWIKFIVED